MGPEPTIYDVRRYGHFVFLCNWFDYDVCVWGEHFPGIPILRKTEMDGVYMNPNDEEDRLNDRKYRNIRISLYLTEGELTEWAREAVKVRARAPQAKVRVKKPHGFANEFEYNTQGIAKFIRKHLFPNWIQTRAERAGKLKELQAEASRMGFRVIDQDEDV